MKNILVLGELMRRRKPYSLRGFSEVLSINDYYLAGAGANVAANLAWGYPNIKTSLISSLVRTTDYKIYLQLLQSYGVKGIIKYFETKGIAELNNVEYQLELPTASGAKAVFFNRKYCPIPAAIKENDFDWDNIFSEKIDLVYADGILLCLENIKTNGEPRKLFDTFFREAKSRNVKIAFDTNFRKSLAENDPDMKKTANIYNQIIPNISYLSGSIGHFLALLGDSNYLEFSKNCFEDNSLIENLLLKIVDKFPNLESIGVTIRDETRINKKWMCALYENNKLYISKIYNYNFGDRPGMGDASTAQFLAGCLNKVEPQLRVERMAAAGWMIYHCVGDVATFDLQEIDAVINEKTDFVR